MANAPRNKVWPHLTKRVPRFPGDEAGPARADPRRWLRRFLAAAVLMVVLAATYPVLHREGFLQQDDGLAHVTACDRLAAHPFDSQKLTPGVPQEQIDVPRAMSACTAALKRQPHDGRTLYQIGRVYIRAKDDRVGSDYVRQSAMAGYAQGQFVYGLFLVSGSRVAEDACAGGALWVKAARQRHFYSKIYLANSWRDGGFKTCELGITEPEIASLLTAAADLVEAPQQQTDLEAARIKWAAGPLPR